MDSKYFDERGVTAPLSADELKVFQFIKLFVMKYYCQPMGREIGDYFGWHHNKVTEIFKSLRQKGWAIKYGRESHILRDS